MYPHRATAFPTDAIQVTWCACERCLGLGPRSITLHARGRERTIELARECCGSPPGKPVSLNQD